MAYEIFFYINCHKVIPNFKRLIKNFKIKKKYKIKNNKYNK